MDSRALIAVLWPSFLLAGVVEVIFFTLFDPHELLVFGAPIDHVGRMSVYTLGFFVFWLLLALMSGVALWVYTRWDKVPAQRLTL
jgi:hypothetical protein